MPYQVTKWRRTHPGEPIADGQIFIQPTMMGPKADQRRRTIFYQYRADRAKRTLKGIDQQIAKAEKAVAGPGRGEAEPVRPAHRRHQERSTGTWRPRPGRWPG